MIQKFPRWLWIGGWALAFVAGFINVIGLLGFEHQAVTHLTGTTSLFAAALASFQPSVALHFLAIISSFVAGAVLSGYLIENTALKLGRHYGTALLIESALLAIAVPLLKLNSVAGVYCACCACGLQNAMVTTYSGTLIRTTHLSGMFTDLGIFLGHRLRGLEVDRPRLKLCLLIISAFFVGGVAGAWVFHFLNVSSLYIPAGLTFLTALSYNLYGIMRKR